MVTLERTGDSRWYYKNGVDSDTDENASTYVKYIMSLLSGDTDDEDLVTILR